MHGTRGAERGSKMITYPEMNEKIKELLKFEGSPNALYALARIEQLEKELAASSCEPHIIGRIGDEDCDITPMLISALTNVCQVFDGWHQDGTVWSKFDEECRQEISKILKICDRRSVR